MVRLRQQREIVPEPQGPLPTTKMAEILDDRDHGVLAEGHFDGEN
jgi:hypothetical protein